MKRLISVTLALIALGALLWFPACQSPEDTGLVDQNLYEREEVPNLDDAYGGFNIADEQPAFDDSALMSEFSGTEDVEYNDPIANQEAVREMERRCNRHFFVRITWGNLERDSTVDFITDWSGSLTVDNGAAILNRVIRFEPADYILPRVRPNLIEWVSHTGPSFDGILAKIVPIGISAEATAPNDSNTTVTFSTGPLSVSFSLAELRDIHKVINVDDKGNAVSFDAIYINPRACPQGFLGGVWKNAPDTVGGIFYGKWMSKSGLLLGHLKGFYGVNSKGDRVFFGKYIDVSGRFRGIIRGHYGPLTNDGLGYFRGVWINRDLVIHGDLMGIWKTSDRIDGGGFFRGVWHKRC